MAEETKVHADEPAKHAGEKPVGKDGNWIEKHKAIAYGGIAFVLIILFLFLRHGSSSSGSSAAQTAASGGIDPATGYLAGSPADTAALSGSGTSGASPSGGDTTTNNYYSGTGSTGNAPVSGTGSTTGSQVDKLSQGKYLGGGKFSFAQSASSLATTLKMVFTNSAGQTNVRYVPASATTAQVDTGYSKGGNLTITPIGANGQAVGSSGSIYVPPSHTPPAVTHAKG